MRKYSVAIFCTLALFLFSDCTGCKRELNTLAAITEHQIHRGEYLGDVPVYVINFIDDTYENEGFHSVYKQEDGTYTIDYLGKDMVLQKMDSSLVLPGCEYSKVNWKFDYNCYIKEIPN